MKEWMQAWGGLLGGGGSIIIAIAAYLVAVGETRSDLRHLESRVKVLEQAPRRVVQAGDPRKEACASIALKVMAGERLPNGADPERLMQSLACHSQP